MLFASNSDNIVIVPPRPEGGNGYEFSYSNLYAYDGGGKEVDCDASTATAATAPSVESSRSKSPAPISSSVSVNDDRAAYVAAFDGSATHFDSVSGNDVNAAATDSAAITRDPRNGAFTFQVHAEYDLLLHIQKDLDKHRRSVEDRYGDISNGHDQMSDVNLSKTIMRSVDEYCQTKQWMYHIGREKGVAIGRFLRGGVESCLRSNGSNGGEVKKFTCVDLGTYCGYSALVLASTLCQILQEHELSLLQEQEDTSSGPLFEFHIYTTEVSSKLLNVAQSVFRLAKMEQYITPVLMKSDGEEQLSESLLKHGVSNIDFLLLDHAKNLYLRDVKDLEGAKLLSAGSYVSADNVVFNRLDEYREHMRKLKLQGVVESRLEEMNLEYSNNLKDGIEMTVYLKDPPLGATK